MTGLLRDELDGFMDNFLAALSTSIGSTSHALRHEMFEITTRSAFILCKRWPQHLTLFSYLARDREFEGLDYMYIRQLHLMQNDKTIDGKEVGSPRFLIYHYREKSH